MEELKQLEINQSLDPKKREAMKKTIQTYARKKKRVSPVKRWLIGGAASAVILISGLLLYPVISQDATLPADENQQNEDQEHNFDDLNDNSEETNDTEDGDNHSDTKHEEGHEHDELQVEEIGEESYEMMVEGMEETSTRYQFRLNPYGYEYVMDEILYDYTIEDGIVKHHAENEDGASVRLSVEENTSIDEVAKELEKNYHDQYEQVSQLEEPSDVESPYSGLSQSAVDTSGEAFDSTIGYYVFQIDEDVLTIDYDYMIEAGDGMAPRLQAMIESISKQE